MLDEQLVAYHMINAHFCDYLARDTTSCKKTKSDSYPTSHSLNPMLLGQKCLKRQIKCMLNQSYLTWVVAIVPNAAVIGQKLDMLSGDNVGKHPCLIYLNHI